MKQQPIDNPNYWLRVSLIFQARTQMKVAKAVADEYFDWNTDEMLIMLRNSESKVADEFGDVK